MTSPPFDAVFFLPGLNAFADERVHIGPLRFGHMAAQWEAAAARRHVPFARSRCVGGDGLVREAARARETFEYEVTEGALAGRQRVRLIAHSTGGLVARAIAAARPEVIADVVTLGSPHAGTPLATVALELLNRKSMLHGLARALGQVFGYNLEHRAATLYDLTPEGAESHAESFPVPQEVPTGFIECRAEGPEIAAPFRALALAFPQARLSEASDGFIHCSSQVFGAKLGQVRLDHYGEFGVAMQATRAERSRTQAEFLALTDRLLGVSD